jgi:hypothetical protein
MPRRGRNADLQCHLETGGLLSTPEEVGDAIMKFSRRGFPGCLRSGRLAVGALPGRRWPGITP